MELLPYHRKVHYYETDQMGIVHHSNHIRWFEEARVDLMEQAGFGYARMEQEGISSPVLGVGCDYRSMVRFGEAVIVRAYIGHLKGTRMTVRYRIEDAENGALRATGETRHCFLNREGRPVSLQRACPAVYAMFREMQEKCPPDLL